MLGRQVIADAVHECEEVFRDAPAEWTREGLDSMFELSAALRRAVESIGGDAEDEALRRVQTLAVRPAELVRRTEEPGAPAAGRAESARTGAAGPGTEARGVEPGGEAAGADAAGPEAARTEPPGAEATGAAAAGTKTGDEVAGVEPSGVEPSGVEAPGTEAAGAKPAPEPATTKAPTPEPLEPSLSATEESPEPSPPATGASPEPASPPPAPPPEPAPSDGAGEVVRVPFAGLDALLNRVGELVTLDTRMEKLLSGSRRDLQAAGLRRPLEEVAERLTRVTAFLHETTIELRMVPIRRVFERFPSVARDLAREGGKRVRVVTQGEDVRIDKGMADAISEPLLHLVRNAVDHGFDPESEAIGTIWLAAERAGDRVRITVEDDGRGLDRAGIVARAREMGIVGPGETLDEADAAELIFRPGFSTRDRATTVSGRGVGLDVVRRKATALRGSLDVQTVASGGTRFVLDLPLTLAIVPAVLFEAAGETLAVPAADVEETLRDVSPGRAAGAEVVTRRDEVIPVARPARLFGWDGAGATDGGGERFAVVVRRGPRRVAILASRLVDQRDVVVKALPAYLGALRGVSGATVTHEARVVLLIDIGGLLDLSLAAHRRRKSEA